MRLKFNLPDLVLENIRQYVGNCRLHNGELIRTINKSSKVIRQLEMKLHNRKINTYCHSYKPLFTKIEDIEGPLPNLISPFLKILPLELFGQRTDVETDFVLFLTYIKLKATL